MLYLNIILGLRGSAKRQNPAELCERSIDETVQPTESMLRKQSKHSPSFLASVLILESQPSGLKGLAPVMMEYSQLSLTSVAAECAHGWILKNSYAHILFGDLALAILNISVLYTWREKGPWVRHTDWVEKLVNSKMQRKAIGFECLIWCTWLKVSIYVIRQVLKLSFPVCETPEESLSLPTRTCDSLVGSVFSGIVGGWSSYPSSGQFGVIYQGCALLQSQAPGKFWMAFLEFSFWSLLQEAPLQSRNLNIR